jgi:hypothetical protein
VILPVQDKQLVYYYLDNLIPVNTMIQVIGVKIAATLVYINQFHHLVPYYYLKLVKKNKLSSKGENNGPGID